MKRSIPTALLFASSLTTGAQSITQTIGGMYAQDGVGAWVAPSGFGVAVRALDEQGAALYAGSHYTISATGSFQGSMPFGPAGNTFLQNVIHAPDGSAFVIGSSLGPEPAGHDALCVHVAADGTQLWSVLVPEDGSQQYLSGMALPDGGVVLCGVADNGTGHDALVTRHASNGEVIWTYRATGAEGTEAYDVATDGTHIMVAGRLATFGGHDDALVMRLDLDGNLVWTSAFGASNNDVGRAILGLGAGSFVMAGWSNSYGPLDQTTQQRTQRIHLVAMDLDGDTLWTRTIGDTLYHQRAYNMVAAPGGGFFLCGERATSGLSDALLMRLSAAGDLEWERILDLGKEERLTHLTPLSDGVLATGWSFGAYGRQLLLVKRNASGN